jgi:threonine synthase
MSALAQGLENLARSSDGNVALAACATEQNRDSHDTPVYLAAYGKRIASGGRIALAPLLYLDDVASQGEPLVELRAPAPGVRLLAKNEAQNVAGSHKLRAASVVVQAIARDGYAGLITGSCGAYGFALAIAARAVGIAATVVLPVGCDDYSDALQESGAVVRWASGTYEDAVEESKRLILEGRIADGNIDGPYGWLAVEALGVIGRELAQVLGPEPTAVWVPLGNGTTALAVARVLGPLYERWRVIGVTAQGHNSILASWPGTNHEPLRAHEVSSSQVREPLVNWSALHGQATIDALHAYHGAVVGVCDRELLEARRVLLPYQIDATPAGSAGLAGVRAFLGGYAGIRTHVAVVTGGRSTRAS